MNAIDASMMNVGIHLLKLRRERMALKLKIDVTRDKEILEMYAVELVLLDASIKQAELTSPALDFEEFQQTADFEQKENAKHKPMDFDELAKRIGILVLVGLPFYIMMWLLE